MNSLINKIDLFMRLYIIPNFKPEHIHWIFSISGGKDSYAMCEGIREWYEVENISFKATGIYIWQWGEESPKEFFKSTLPWLYDIQIIDARDCTVSILKKDGEQQAPCRACSDIRHYFSDIFLKQINTDSPTLLCRGLHFTDMTISILWRLAWYGIGNRLEGKGYPLVPLAKNIYLAKPLCFVREYECQVYASQNNYMPLTCKCPAHLYPSRRDIVEESLRLFYTSSLWEFDVPGSKQYLHNIARMLDVSYLKKVSLGGHETKNKTIPDEYFEFTKEYFLQTPIYDILPNSTMLLERCCESFLKQGVRSKISEQRCSCKLFTQPDSLSQIDYKMIGTLGPFWASMALPSSQREYYRYLQKQIWGFDIDINWSQVYLLMKRYYKERM